MKVQTGVKGKSVGLSPKTIDNKREPGLNLKFYCKPNTLKSPVPVGFTGSIVQNALLSALFGVQSCALIIPVQFSFAKYLEIPSGFVMQRASLKETFWTPGIEDVFLTLFCKLFGSNASFIIPLYAKK